MILTPINRPTVEELAFATLDDTLVYDISRVDWIAPTLAQGALGTVWGPGAIITLDLLAKGATNYQPFPDGAVTYTSFGTKQRQRVTGYERLRVRVSTVGTGTATLFFSINGVREPASLVG